MWECLCVGKKRHCQIVAEENIYRANAQREKRGEHLDIEKQLNPFIQLSSRLNSGLFCDGDI